MPPDPREHPVEENVTTTLDATDTYTSQCTGCYRWFLNERGTGTYCHRCQRDRANRAEEELSDLHDRLSRAEEALREIKLHGDFAAGDSWENNYWQVVEIACRAAWGRR